MRQERPLPTQQQFENRVAAAYYPLREAKRICVEVEDWFGPISVGPALRRQIVASPMVCVERDFAERVERTSSLYGSKMDASLRGTKMSLLPVLKGQSVCGTKRRTKNRKLSNISVYTQSLVGTTTANI